MSYAISNRKSKTLTEQLLVELCTLIPVSKCVADAQTTPAL